MTNNTALFVVDTHGIRYAYERAFDIANQRSIDTIILGGDLTPKRVSIKLKDHEIVDDDNDSVDYDGERTIPGEIIPLILLRPSEHNLYLDSLLNISDLNKRYEHPDQLEQEEVNRGNIVYRADNAFYDLGCMITEYVVLTKLFDFFSRGERSGRKLEFTEDEMNFLGDFLQTLKEVEERFSPERKKSYEDKWNNHLLGRGIVYPKTFGSFERKFYFSELAPSQNLMSHLVYGDRISEVEELERKIADFVNEQDSSVANLLLSELELVPIRVRLASHLMDVYDSDLFKGLIESTSLQQLKKMAESPDVYIQGQRDFVNGYFRDKIKEFRKANPNGRIYVILGNDDRTEIEDDVKKLHEEGLITYISGDAVGLGKGLSIAGYPFVRDTKGKFYGGWEKSEEEIRRDLEGLSQKSDSRRTIYVCHSPPFNGNLDIAFNGEHIGSQAIAEFVKQCQPPAVLSGHVHESYRKSGQVMERRGNTLCFNPGGDHNKDKFRAIVFSIDDIGSYEVIEK